MDTNGSAHVRALVLDATPLITQPYTHYQNYARSFYTTPTVLQEIRDEQARKNLEIWQSLGTLELRHPKEASIKRVSTFAKATGDYSVLSANDIHILALSYELETELNKGDWRLRRTPGDSLNHLNGEDLAANTIRQPGEVATKKKSRRRGGKKQRAKREANEKSREEQTVVNDEDDAIKHNETAKNTTSYDSQVTDNAPLPVPDSSSEVSKVATTPKEENTENEAEIPSSSISATPEGDYFEDDDDGEWISVDNLTETIIKHSGEDTTGSHTEAVTEEERALALSAPRNQVALATGDFAIQNVALQMNLNLMNFISGLRIKRLRNYMLRCHACFRLFPIPKNGKSLHFCPSCGGQGTVLRCAVSVDSATGDVTPHLKANFQWNNRGTRYSIASPLSKNSQKKYGKKGFVHSKATDSTNILRQDQREYEKVIKQDEWTKNHNEKVLNNWIGGGSADNYISPFAISGIKHHSVRIGKGRYANSNKKRS